MPTVWIPPLLQPGGTGPQVEVEGDSVRAVIDALDARYPGMRARLCRDDGQLKPEIAVAVDGEVVVSGVRSRLQPTSEVHFLPALSGG